MLACLAAVVVASSGPSWVEIATLVVVVVVPLTALLGWLGRKQFAIDITWTDGVPEPEAERREPERIVVGRDNEVYVRVRPRMPIEIGRFDVRLQEDVWYWEWARPRLRHVPRRIYESAPPDAIRVVALSDGNRKTFIEGKPTGTYPRELSTSFHRKDKSLLVAEYAPAWRTAGAVIWEVTLHPTREWAGLLTLTPPNALGRRVWKRLPIVAVAETTP